MFDLLLVKYTRTEKEEKIFKNTFNEVCEWGAIVYLWDNSLNNIGLVAGRNNLLKKCNSDVVILMDYDFNSLNIDLKGMAALLKNESVGMVVPRHNRDWYYPDCNFMMLRRKDVLLNADYFTAYADWDLINNLRARGLKIVEHKSSEVDHIGLSSDNPAKKEIWAKDRAVYDA